MIFLLQTGWLCYLSSSALCCSSCSSAYAAVSAARKSAAAMSAAPAARRPAVALKKVLMMSSCLGGRGRFLWQKHFYRFWFGKKNSRKKLMPQRAALQCSFIVFKISWYQSMIFILLWMHFQVKKYWKLLLTCRFWLNKPTRWYFVPLKRFWSLLWL